MFVFEVFLYSALITPQTANGKWQMALALGAGTKGLLGFGKKIKSTGGCRVRPAMNNLIAQQKRTERYERGRGEANLLGARRYRDPPLLGQC